MMPSGGDPDLDLSHSEDLTDSIADITGEPTSIGHVQHKLQLMKINLQRKEASYENLKVAADAQELKLMEEIEILKAKLNVANVKSQSAMQTVETCAIEHDEMKNLLQHEQLASAELKKLQIDLESIESFLQLINYRESCYMLDDNYQCPVTGFSALDYSNLVHAKNISIEDHIRVKLFEVVAHFRLAGGKQSVNDVPFVQRALDALPGAATNIDRVSFDMMRDDKTYLHEKVIRLDAELTAAKSQVIELRNSLDLSKASYQELLAEQKLSERKMNEALNQRMERQAKELNRLTQDEVSRLKSITDELHQRELSLLRCQKEELTDEKAVLQVKVAHLEKDLERTKLELRTTLSEYSQYVMKTKPVQSESDLLAANGRLEHLANEVSVLRAQLEESRVNNDALKLKLQETSRLYYEADTKHQTEKEVYCQKVSALETRLSQYLKLEEELDRVVEANSRSVEEMLRNRTYEADNYNNSAVAQRPVLPVLASRRVEHSLALSKRILALNVEIDQLKRDNTALQREVAESQRTAKVAQDIIVYNGQPNNVLAKALTEREVTIADLRENLANLQRTLERADSEFQRLLRERNEMAKDLALLLNLDARQQVPIRNC